MLLSVVHGHREGPHPRAYRVKAAPGESPFRPPAAPDPGLTADQVREQLLEDPEYLEWMAEERAAEFAAMTRRAYRS